MAIEDYSFSLSSSTELVSCNYQTEKGPTRWICTERQSQRFHTRQSFPIDYIVCVSVETALREEELAGSRGICSHLNCSFPVGKCPMLDGRQRLKGKQEALLGLIQEYTFYFLHFRFPFSSFPWSLCAFSYRLFAFLGVTFDTNIPLLPLSILYIFLFFSVLIHCNWAEIQHMIRNDRVLLASRPLFVASRGENSLQLDNLRWTRSSLRWEYAFFLLLHLLWQFFDNSSTIL